MILASPTQTVPLIRAEVRRVVGRVDDGHGQRLIAHTVRLTASVGEVDGAVLVPVPSSLAGRWKTLSGSSGANRAREFMDDRHGHVPAQAGVGHALARC